MTNENYYRVFDKIVEDLQVDHKDGLSNAISKLINISMELERDKALQVEPYQRSEERLGHRNGYKDKTLKTRIGDIPIQIPQVRGMEFYPGSIEKGCRSERALKLAIAQMYIQGVSTRRVSKIVEQLCGFQVSQSQVSNASKLLDEEIKLWRERKLGKYKYLIVDATYEKCRINNSVVSASVLVAFGIDDSGTRSILGISTEISEAEVHWRRFLQSLTDRGLHGIEMITSDSHTGLKAARQAVFPTIPWQRCQFHLQQNATSYVPKKSMNSEVSDDIRTIFNAPNKEEANRFLKIYTKKYEVTAPSLSQWMEENIPESLTVFNLPKCRRKKLRTSNMAERHMREIKRRTKVAGIFPNRESVNRLVSAILMEIDDTWNTGKRYLNMDPD